jgi:predicted phage-related endonuclease
MAVWLDKKGMVEERPDPDKEFLLDLGLRLEPIIAELYERATGKQTSNPVPMLWRHTQHPVLIATPDRFVIGTGSPIRGLELKTENQFSDQFGDPGTDQVPHHYFIQCVHYMAVCGMAAWDVAVLHGGVKFSVYHLERDEELEEAMISQLLGWWDKHIVGDTPPDVDSSDAWKIYLHKKHPIELLPIAEIDPESVHVAERLAKVREAERVLEALRSELENQLKNAIGDREGVYTPYGKITWKRTKDGEKVDWESAYIDLRRQVREKLRTYETPEFAMDSFELLASMILDAHTNPKPGVRRFLFTPTKERTHGHQPGEIAGAALAAIADVAGDGQHGSGGTGKGSD